MTVTLIIVGMAIATYLPRVLPVFIMDRIHFPAWVNKWLQAIPYAALGALIVPGIFTVEPGAPLVGVIGGLVAAVIAYFRGHIMIVIIAAIAVVYVIQRF
ncbi:AzlD domain-containing protein [Natribacillus halophilus]|uniref:Branched-chain amino acid transport protein n=1 Tax=Natribacillus halophilus TaxID=549003 RepID=A0A1G8J457_9BACI|nr:AzlD domain-containing protein [Natribacillus halophilus]SDI25843.1 Branched-chain amino acid transport protein [Natribacillus halophilus]